MILRSSFKALQNKCMKVGSDTHSKYRWSLILCSRCYCHWKCNTIISDYYEYRTAQKRISLYVSLLRTSESFLPTESVFVFVCFIVYYIAFYTLVMLYVLPPIRGDVTWLKPSHQAVVVNKLQLVDHSTKAQLSKEFGIVGRHAT